MSDTEDREMTIESDKGERRHVTIRPKTFRTGSKGYYVWGKVVIDGKRYQVSGNLVEIGSKSKK